MILFYESLTQKLWKSQKIRFVRLIQAESISASYIFPIFSKKFFIVTSPLP